MSRILVLGLGNVLLGDEGIGIWVATSLQRHFAFPPSVEILEGGTLGLDLLPRLQGVERLLLIDAVRSGRSPGELVRLEGDAVAAALDLKISPHQIGVRDLLAAARLVGTEPPLVVLWGMEPDRLEPGTAFSPAVLLALPALRAWMLEELEGWGVCPRTVEQPPAAPPWWPPPVSRAAP